MRELAIIPGDPDQTFSDTLGDEQFEFRFWWAEEVQTFFLGTRGLSNDFSMAGKALSVGVDLWGPYRVPYGALVLIGDEYGAPDLATLGDTFKVVWFSPEETAAL